MVPSPRDQWWQLSDLVGFDLKLKELLLKKSPCDNIHGVNIETRVFSDEGWGGVTTSENHRRREVCRIVDLKSNVEIGFKKLL